MSWRMQPIISRDGKSILGSMTFWCSALSSMLLRILYLIFSHHGFLAIEDMGILSHLIRTPILAHPRISIHSLTLRPFPERSTVNLPPNNRRVRVLIAKPSRSALGGWEKIKKREMEKG